MNAPAFVRHDLVPERPAPVKTTGLVGFLRTRLFNTPTNIVITILGALLLWFTVGPAIKFMLIDAVWTGKDRDACLAEKVGRTVGACWPFVSAKFNQFIYGFYPEAERWRPNLTFLLAAVLLIPLLIPRLPGKGINAALFFIAFPVVAFFLLHGGGIKGFAITWTVNTILSFLSSITGGRMSAAALSSTGPMLVWVDLLATAVIVSGLVLWLRGGMRAGFRPIVTTLGVFAG